jgi:hypothetical protein
MMASSFLNLDDDKKSTKDVNIGAGLKSKPKAPRVRADKEAVAKAGEAHGFTRSTGPVAEVSYLRKGRPPLNEDMTYWRIYLTSSLRNELNQIRDAEGRRLNDVLEDMLATYKASKG